MRRALFADVFSDLLCRMEAAANGIGCVDSHTGGVLPFSPFLRQGTFADRYRDKERCRKKKAILAVPPPFNLGKNLFFIYFKIFVCYKTHPFVVPTCRDSKTRLRY